MCSSTLHWIHFSEPRTRTYSVSTRGSFLSMRCALPPFHRVPRVLPCSAELYIFLSTGVRQIHNTSSSNQAVHTVQTRRFPSNHHEQYNNDRRETVRFIAHLYETLAHIHGSRLRSYIGSEQRNRYLRNGTRPDHNASYRSGSSRPSGLQLLANQHEDHRRKRRS